MAKITHVWYCDTSFFVVTLQRRLISHSTETEIHFLLTIQGISRQHLFN